MGVYGASGAPSDGGGAIRIHEGLTPQPTDIYGASKLLCEELAAFYARARGVRGVALRFGMFVPEPFGHYGVRMLYGGVDERDVASAVLAALDRTDAGLPFGTYNIMSELPYTEGDAADLRADLMAVVRRHWPHAPEAMDRADAIPWGPVHNWYDIGRAQRDLGWRPRWNFTEFVAAVHDGVTDASSIVPRRE
jgi:nucleoside-diphosphate-sugar epimerase